MNIVWIERGILLTLIYYILKYYNKLINKTIIVSITNYRKILRKLFPELTFSHYTESIELNIELFYFNIRGIIKKQDIVIDYISNHDILYTNKISLIPWYDMNDALVVYEYNDNNMLHTHDIILLIKEFSLSKRHNYINDKQILWDIWMEYHILKKYSRFSNSTINNVFNNMNKHITSKHMITSDTDRDINTIILMINNRINNIKNLL
jgi:hypothetical protein